MYKIPIKKFEPTPDEKRQAAMDKAYYNKKTEFGVGYGGEPTYSKATPTNRTYPKMETRAATPQESLEARTKKPLLKALNKFK